MALSDKVVLPINTGNGAGMIGMGMFNQGMDRFGGAIDKYSTRTRNAAINNILGQEKLENEDASGYQTRINTLLGNVEGLDPLQKIGLSNAASKPIFDKEAREVTAANRLFDEGIDNTKLAQTHEQNMATQQYRADTLAETSRYHKATEGDYGTFTDDYGKSWKINKNDGTMEVINTGVYGSDGVPFGGAGGKNIIMVDKTVPDGFGGSTKVKVPVDKRTGLDAEGNQPQVVKRATLIQNDKDFLDNFGSIQDNLDTATKYIEGPHLNKDFGPADDYWNNPDNTFGGWGSFFNSKSANRQSEFRALSSGMMQKVIKQFGANPSDIDLKKLEQQIPQGKDNEDVVGLKLQNFKKLYEEGQASSLYRIYNSNPQAVKPVFDKIRKTGATVRGYDIQFNTATGEYRMVRK